MSDYGAANSKLANYETDYSDEIISNDALQKEVNWLDDIIDIASGGNYLNELSQSQYDLIQKHADLYAGSSSLKAQNILNFFYDGAYSSSHTINLPSTQDKTSNGPITHALTQDLDTDMDIDLDNNLTMSLFSNPVKSWLGVRVEGDDRYHCEVYIYNLSGRLIYSHSGLSSGEHTISLDRDMPSGIYLTSLYQNNQRIDTQTFTKL